MYTGLWTARRMSVTLDRVTTRPTDTPDPNDPYGAIMRRLDVLDTIVTDVGAIKARLDHLESITSPVVTQRLDNLEESLWWLPTFRRSRAARH